MAVSALGYFGVSVSDLDAWRAFGTNILGLELAGDDAAGLRFRADEAPWRIAVEPGGADDLSFAGFEAESESELESLASRLRASGFAVEEDPALAEQRGVARLLRTSDPDGLRCELYHGREARAATPFRSPLDVSAFVTDGRGIGHLVIAVSDIAAARRFYEELLGFRLSDSIDMNIGPVSLRAIFLHCNPRHHSLALVPIAMPRRLHHFMLQVAEFDDVGEALDRVKKAGIRIASTLGKHSNDHMLSFYMETPSGFEVEYGYGAREIDDSVWVPEIYDTTSLWGHDRGQAH